MLESKSQTRIKRKCLTTQGQVKKGLTKQKGSITQPWATKHHKDYIKDVVPPPHLFQKGFGKKKVESGEVTWA